MEGTGGVSDEDGDKAMASRLMRIHLVVAVVATLGFLAVPDGGLLQTGWQVAAGWYAAVMVVVGVTRRRPAVPAAWWMFAFGVAANVGGILVEAILTRTQID